MPAEDRARNAFVGIDIAVAKGKRLPICVCVHDGPALFPLPLRRKEIPKPPAMCGNGGCIEADHRQRLARETIDYLKAIENSGGVTIKRIAIDAPSAARRPGLSMRRAEQALQAKGIFFINTPPQETFDGIPAKVRAYEMEHRAERAKGLSHANQIWMMFGFDLFLALRAAGWDCIEVYPNAIVHALDVHRQHKSKAGVALEQLKAASQHTGWPRPGDDAAAAVRTIGFGSLHDRVDAYLSAWVASLPESGREPLGAPPDDVIWCPRLPQA